MSRRPSITERIPKEKTGLKGSLYVHVEFNPSGLVEEIRFSEKGKDGSTLDQILTALGESVTEIVKEIQQMEDTVEPTIT